MRRITSVFGPSRDHESRQGLLSSALAGPLDPARIGPIL